uniref:DNA-directed RNA polymerase subunit n=1 Tax=Chromera velia CCMP2878 TaxID=1169474 RepID=A0A0G4HFH6_9ALVE|eukprot:Cvel_27010.t1-p1 / transcript=Cvel_27010.t1 / gene=Cvel_27010 / organism=Chromera_velia_CCMP2878 / gene_product=DNA-directed RNA polymerase III subunit rpc1, putative / transcript_product=DNA-directed RNA polymerase III subunit rpc1, putative / location=Cvel_scaffold3302:8881-16649(-) / protein_length=1639 / sequence_SO=supercontig / SO=protein_coding / is_pseudo=false
MVHQTAGLWEFLSIQCALFVNSDMPGVPPQPGGVKPIRGVCQRLKGKEGRFRGNLSGKRVDFSGRTVISPDPNVGIDQVVVPEWVAKKMTFPERVNSINRARLSAAVMRGDDEWPGAKYVRRRDGTLFMLRHSNRRSHAEKLQIGDVVERHLMNGDVVLFNRQPSLHRMSIMAHRAKVMPWRTFRFNECVCAPYNADFDGDEMNLHLPQTEEARAEAFHLMSTVQNLVTPKNGEPLIACTQDFLTCAYLLTYRDTFLTRSQMALACAAFSDASEHIQLPPPTIMKPLELWTGKQVISALLKPNAHSKVLVNLVAKERDYQGNEHMDPHDGWVIFRDSELLCGAIGKATLGGSKGGLIFHLIRDNSPKTAAQCMGRIAKLSGRWLSDRGMTIGIDDVTPTAAARAEHKENLRKGREDVAEKIREFRKGLLPLKPGMSAEETLEALVKSILDEIRNTAGRTCKRTLKRLNKPLIMFLCGSKGQIINIGQMVACVGQQNVGGQRIHNGFVGRTLPHFRKFAKDEKARGFVANSFFSGLEPAEFFFHTMSGREGLVDTAVKTAETGYMQRRLMKAMEDLSVQYDRTVRTSDAHIVQFLYGDDALNPERMEGKDGLLSLTHVLEQVSGMVSANARACSRSAAEKRGEPPIWSAPLSALITETVQPMHAAEQQAAAEKAAADSRKKRKRVLEEDDEEDQEKEASRAARKVTDAFESNPMETASGMRPRILPPTPRYVKVAVSVARDAIKLEILRRREKDRDRTQAATAPGTGQSKVVRAHSGGDSYLSVAQQRLLASCEPHHAALALQVYASLPSFLATRVGVFFRRFDLPATADAFAASLPDSLDERVVHRGLLTSEQRSLRSSVAKDGGLPDYSWLALPESVDRQAGALVQAVTAEVVVQSMSPVLRERALLPEEVCHWSAFLLELASDPLPLSVQAQLVLGYDEAPTHQSLTFSMRSFGSELHVFLRAEAGRASDFLVRFVQSAVEEREKEFDLEEEDEEEEEGPPLPSLKRKAPPKLVAYASKSTREQYELFLDHCTWAPKPDSSSSAPPVSAGSGRGGSGTAEGEESLTFDWLSVERRMRNAGRSVTPRTLLDFIILSWRKYQKGLIEPGEAVGAVGAQSIGEPGTQMTLKTFHFAGVASMNVTLGVPRIKEIINAARVIQTPIIECPLVNPRSVMSARVVKGKIEQTLLGDVAAYLKETYDSTGCYVTVKLCEDTIERLALDVNAETVRAALLADRGLKLGDADVLVKNFLKVQVFPPARLEKEQVYFTLQRIKAALPSLVLAGVPSARRGIINETKSGDLEVWVEGYGLLEMMGIEGVVGTRTQTNHIAEVEKFLGIEAARAKIVLEIRKCLEAYGMEIDVRHMHLLADVMSFRGEVLGISRFGIAKMRASTLMLASFEETNEHLFEASIHQRRDDVKGVSECIIMGKSVSLGTGLFDIIKKPPPALPPHHQHPPSAAHGQPPHPPSTRGNRRISIANALAAPLQLHGLVSPRGGADRQVSGRSVATSLRGGGETPSHSHAPPVPHPLTPSAAAAAASSGGLPPSFHTPNRVGRLSSNVHPHTHGGLHWQLAPPRVPLIARALAELREEGKVPTGSGPGTGGRGSGRHGGDPSFAAGQNGGGGGTVRSALAVPPFPVS